MNLRDPDREAARAKKDWEAAAALAELGITPAEASLFNVLHYGLTVPPSDLCCRATGRDYSVGGQLTLAESQSALAGCFAKGWLQVVDESILASLRDEIRRAELLGPIYDYPPLGGVDFTHAGAEQWFRICKRLWPRSHKPSFAFCDVVHEKSSYYFHSELAALAERERRKEFDNVVAVTEPAPIGPWRTHWWRRFPAGYRIDVDERMRWQGRGSSAGTRCCLNAVIEPGDIARVRDILDRHNITWIEWLVLASLERWNDGGSIVSDVARHSEWLGTQLTHWDCQMGLEACLLYGWLRAVDEQVSTEIQDLLRTDPVFMPVPFGPAKGRSELEFSTAGVELYRMVAVEIYGRDWEDSLFVEDNYYREEHRYCETDAGLARVLQQYVDFGETPNTVRTFPIGPWCVYWWERLPAGYVMELTFGKP